MSKNRDARIAAQIENLEARISTANSIDECRDIVEVAFNKGKGGAATAKEPKAKTEKAERGPSVRQRVLEALSKTPAGMTRSELAAKLGIAKGWSKLLGAATKGNGSGMEGEGLVKSTKKEDQTAMVYTITAAGKKELA